jgi:hypothetical protein
MSKPEKDRDGAGDGEPRVAVDPATTVAHTTRGPVQAEVFVLRLNGGSPEVAGPCGPDPWYIEIGDEDPVDVVSRLSRNLLGEPLLVHSTSWRRDRGSVILSFVVVIADDQAPELSGGAVGRAELARSGRTEAPAGILTDQVLEHGLRHLAWLAKDDPVVDATLSAAWKRVLDSYTPEPFRAL